MPVTRVDRWLTTKGEEFDNELDANTQEAFDQRAEAIDQALSEIWWQGIRREEVVQVLVRNFDFRRI